MRKRSITVGEALATLPWVNIALIVVLVLAAVVRFAALGSIPPGMWYDEAIYSLGGLSVGHGNWPLFFITEGHPFEPLYPYSLAAAFAIAGPSVITARCVSALWGTATVILFYAFARRALGRNWGVVAVAALAFLRWHVHFSRTIFRALLPSFFMVALAVLFLRWHEKKRPFDAIACGVVLGLGFYSYLSFRLAPVVLVAWMVWLVARGELSLRREWRQVLLLWASAAVAFLPLGIDYVRHPAHFTLRTEEVSMFTREVQVRGADGVSHAQVVRLKAGEAAAAIAENAWGVAKVWTVRGDYVGRHGIPYRPVFDWLSGGIFIIGIGWCLRRSLRDQFAFVTLVWIFVFSMASVFSFGAPNLLRMQGAVPAVALAYVFGLRACWQMLARTFQPSAATYVCAIFFVYFAATQMAEYFIIFPRDAEVQRNFLKYEFVEPATAVKQIAPDVKHVYVPDEMAGHLTFKFITSSLDNMTTYGPSFTQPTERPIAVLVTMRSAQLAQSSWISNIGAIHGAHRMNVIDILERPDTHQPRFRWAELWRID